jgi:hypothetical protein
MFVGVSIHWGNQTSGKLEFPGKWVEFIFALDEQGHDPYQYQEGLNWHIE